MLLQQYLPGLKLLSSWQPDGPFEALVKTDAELKKPMMGPYRLQH